MIGDEHKKEDDLGNAVVDVHQVIRDMAGDVLKDEIVQHVYFFREGLIERMEIRKQDSRPTEQSSQGPASKSATQS